MYSYYGYFAGKKLVFSFHNPETASYYTDSLLPYPTSGIGVCVPVEVIHEMQLRWHVSDTAYVEYILSCYYACDELMRSGRMVLHSASFLWRDKAYLFSAPSGTGKTTQLRNWLSLYGTEIEILNGDKPILQVDSFGKVIVHPSPWKGKEGLGRDDLSAPLGGIILLQQDKSNRIEQIPGNIAAKALFGRIYSSFSTEEDVILAASLLEQILNARPVWQLRNLGDLDSTKLTYRTMLEASDNEVQA